MKKLILCFLAVVAGLSQVAVADEPSDSVSTGAVKLNEVVVSHSASAKLKGNTIGVERIELEDMSHMPMMFGERDVVKSLQLLPGVKAESDGTSGFQVRGGTSSQNLILLDGAPVVNAGHMMGIFSTFNDDVLASASLYKGQIPAWLGGGVSSVLDVSTKAGDKETYHYGGSIGLLAAKIAVDGPIVKDKLSFSLSGRRSYFDLFLKCMERFSGTVLNFYDLNAKVDYDVSECDRMSLSFFNCRDNIGLEDFMGMNWGNTTLSYRWSHMSGDNLYNSLTGFYSYYRSGTIINIIDDENNMDGFIRQYGIKDDLTFHAGGSQKIRVGAQTTYLELLSAEWLLMGLYQREKRDSWQNAVWVDDEWTVNERLTAEAGVRLSTFTALGGAPYYEIDGSGNITHVYDYGRGKFVKTYVNAAPRAGLNYRVTDNQSVKAGYSRTVQHLHALRNAGMTMPFDRYMMSSNIVRPQVSDQVSAGYTFLSRDGVYEISAEGYYKDISNVLDYKDGKIFRSEIEMERLIECGKGRSYGAELLLKKHSGRLTGWVSYTLSWSRNKIAGINGGRWYTASNDRRHDLSIAGMYAINDKWHLTATWKYNTGQALTAPSGKYEMNGETHYYYAERNGYRAPDYHRLDISLSRIKRTKRYESEWTFGFYNLYNRYNPFVVSFENDDERPSGMKVVQRSLFGILPSVSYSIRF